MISKLMKMEERIVLDGTVASAIPAAANAVANIAEANTPNIPDALAPLNDDTEETENHTPGSEFEDTQDLSELATQSIGAEDNPDSIETETVIVAMEEALDNIENSDSNDTDSLKALIVNTDIADSAELIEAAAEDVIVITYNNDTADMQNLIDQLDAIAGDKEYESIALVTHSGAGGEIIFSDSEQISRQSLHSNTAQSEFFSDLGELLTDNGRLDLLSCYTGLGEAGNELISTIEEISGAEVAASTDATGNEEFGGDWILERGDIEVSSIYFNNEELDNYSSVLGSYMTSTEVQKLVGEYYTETDQQFGEEMDYYDGTDDGVDNGLLAVLADSSNSVYLYRNSAAGFTHETTISLPDTTNPLHIAVSDTIDGEYLVVTGENDSMIPTVFLFQEDGTTGWSEIVNETDALTSEAFNSGENGDIYVDALGETIILGMPEANSYSGKALIYEMDMNATSGWNFTEDLSATLLPTFDSDVTPKPAFGNIARLVDADGDGDADQAYLTSRNGDNGNDGDGTLGIRDGVYLSSSTNWGMTAGGGTTAQNITITRTDAVFETTNAVATALSGDIGKTDNIEILSYDNSGTLTQDIFVSYLNSTDSNYGVAIVSGTVNASTYAFNMTGTDFTSITTPKDGDVTFASHLCDNGDRLVAIGTKYLFGEINTIDVYRNSSGSWAKETGNGIVAALTPPDTNLTDNGLGSGIVITNDTTLLASAPSYEGGSFSYRELKQGVYEAIYSAGQWGTPAAGSTYVADKIISSLAPAYLVEFGAHISVDENIAAISTPYANDGILIFSYDAVDDEWDYISTLEFTDLSSDLGGCCWDIWDLAISGTSVIASVHSDSEKELIYVFDGVTVGRTDPYETDTLAYTGYDSLAHSKVEFGRNIKMQNGAIFTTYTFANSSSDISSAVLGYYHDGNDWGTAQAGANLADQTIACTTSANYDLMYMDIDSAEGTNEFNIIVSNYKSSLHASVVTLFTGVSNVDNGTSTILSFAATSHGGDSSSDGFGSSVAINNDIITIGMQGYTTSSYYDIGAIAVYQADSPDIWQSGEESLTAVLTLDESVTIPASMQYYKLGSSDILIGDSNEVFSSAGYDGYFNVYGWNIADATATSAVEILNTPDLYTNSDSQTTDLNSLGYSTTQHKLFTGRIYADKGITDVWDTGAVYIFDVTNYTEPLSSAADMEIHSAYVTGMTADDLGDIILNFSQSAFLSSPGSGIALVFTDMTTSQETTVTLTDSEANAFFNSEHTLMTIDLNNAKFNFLAESTEYSLYIAASTFADNNGNPETAPLSYFFTTNSEFQKLLGKYNPETDSYFGTEIEYSNNRTLDTNDDVLAVLGQSDFDNVVYMYRNSPTYGYILETTIILGSSSDYADISLTTDSSAANSQVLVVSQGNTVYLFEEDASGWTNITSTTDATTSKVFTGSELKVDLIGTTLAVSDKAELSNHGKVYIYDKTNGDSNNWELTSNADFVSEIRADSGTGIPEFGSTIFLHDYDNDYSADQIFISSATGFLTGNQVKDGIYLVKSSKWNIESNVVVQLDSCVFNTETETSAGSTVADIEVISYTPDNGTTFYEDLFITYQKSDNSYSLAIVNGTLDLSSDPADKALFSSPPSVTTEITSASQELTLASFSNADGTNRVLATSTGYIGPNTEGSVNIYNYNTSNSTWELNTGSGVTANDPDGVGTEGNGLGTALLFLHEDCLLASTPVNLNGSVTDAADKQGIFEVLYNNYADRWESPQTHTANQADMILSTPAEFYNNFATHIAVDNNMAVITTDDPNDGIMVYTLNIATHQWTQVATLEFQNLLSDLGETTMEIWDLAISGSTVIASVHSRGIYERELVYVFDDVSQSRPDPYQSAVLYFSSSDADYPTTDLENDFGRDIDIENGAIFVSNYYHGATPGDTTDDSYNALVYFYYDNQWGITEGCVQTQQLSYSYTTTSSSFDHIFLDGDKIEDSSHYNLAVSFYNSSTHESLVYVSEDLGYGEVGSDQFLSFNATSHGGEVSSYGFGSGIAINDNIIAVGVEGYTTASHTAMGAIAIFSASSTGWLANEGSLTGILTLNNSEPICNYALGGSEIVLGDNGEVLATAGSGVNYHTYGWNISSAVETESTVETLSNPDLYNSSDPDSTPISSIAFSDENNVLFVGNNMALKNTPETTATGTAYLFNVTNSTDPAHSDVIINTSYIAGENSGDMGDIVVTFNEAIYLTDSGSGLTMYFYNMTTSQETTVTFTYNEVQALFNSSHTRMDFDLNNAKFSFVTNNSEYSVYIPQETFSDSSGDPNPDPISYMFTVQEGSVIITPTDPEDNPTYIPPTDQGNDQNNNPTTPSVTDPIGDITGDITDPLSLGDLADMLNGGLGDSLGALLGLEGNANDPLAIADALGLGLGSGLPLGTADAIDLGLGLADAIAMADTAGLGDTIQDAANAASEAAAETAAEGGTPAEAAEAAIEAAQESLGEDGNEGEVENPAEAAETGENTEGEAETGESEGEPQAEGEETAEGEEAEVEETEGEETAESEEEAEGEETEGEETAEGEETTDEEAGDNEAQGEASAEADNQNEGDQQQDNNQAGNTQQTFSPAGPAQSMMVSEPFAENVSAQQTQQLFNSSIQAFSSLALDSGSSAFGTMAQDAMGDTMTTAALVNSSEQVLNAAREFLAMLDVDEFDNLEYSMSGSGYTAATESVSMIIEDAIAAMVEARGNALIANDLLRILSINIKGFEDRLAENSFSAGVQRLANCNQELAYSYEVLNAILKEVQISKDTGEILSTAEMKELLPEITAKAREVSLSVSEKGDRASKDVLTFLTKRMQQKGIDRENLQAQVDNIFQEWHSNLGLSAPITAQTIEADIATAM